VVRGLRLELWSVATQPDPHLCAELLGQALDQFGCAAEVLAARRFHEPLLCGGHAELTIEPGILVEPDRCDDAPRRLPLDQTEEVARGRHILGNRDDVPAVLLEVVNGLDPVCRAGGQVAPFEDLVDELHIQPILVVDDACCHFFHLHSDVDML
jgi:hypothetical protein